MAGLCSAVGLALKFYSRDHFVTENNNLKDLSAQSLRTTKSLYLYRILGCHSKNMKIK